MRGICGIVVMALLMAGCAQHGAATASSTSAGSSTPAGISRAATTPGPSGPAPDPGAELRGFMSPIGFWDTTFTPVTEDLCVTQGFDNTGPLDRQWRLPSGALACARAPSVGAWDGRLVNVMVFFDPRVDSHTALATITDLLPTDATKVGDTRARNAAYSKYQDGSCEHLSYASDAVASVMNRVNPTWTGARGVDVELLSGTATSSDGSDDAYQDGSVHAALIGIGSGGLNVSC
jgi:hypothetical protein